MKISLVLLAAVLLFTLSGICLAVFPSKPLLDPQGRPIPASKFVETPRMIDGRRYMPGASETIVVILVEFPADSVDADTTAIADTCSAVAFKTGHDSTYYRGKVFSETAGSNSMDEYWDECSLGQMDITGVVLGPYTMPHSMAYYGWDTDSCPPDPLHTVIDDGWNDDAGTVDCTTCPGGLVNTGSCRLIKDAVEAADADINYCYYDTDGDANIDHVMVVHAGKGQEIGSSAPRYCIWSWFYPSLNYGPYDATGPCTGVWVQHGFIVPEYYVEPDSFPLGTFCHEFSHSIGNPDLYDPDAGLADVPDQDDHPVADWCLMDHGSWCGPTGTAERPSHLLAFNKAGTGWIPITVVRPTKDTTTFTIDDLEDVIFPACAPTTGTCGQAFKLSTRTMKGDYFLIENRYTRDASLSYDKFDSDWSDWTGQGGPDSLDCGLIITHIMVEHAYNIINQGKCGYDYVTGGDTCPCTTWPYEVWVEDPGYDDRHSADWDEWWYPWEVKAGAAYADSSAEEPHYVFSPAIHSNANCTRTPSSIDVSGTPTGIYVEATKDCSPKMTMRIFLPGWIGNPQIENPAFCRRWHFFHHDMASGGFGYGGGMPNMLAPYNDRMSLVWSAPGATSLRSSPVVTDAEIEVAPDDIVKGLAVVATSDGMVLCYGARDGRTIWTATVGIDPHSTPIACDSVFAKDGTCLELNRVYVNGPMGRLYWLDLATGSIEGYWEEPMGHPLEADPRIALLEDPGAPGTYVPLIFVGSMGGSMYAINALTGIDEWDYPAGPPINCPAAMGDIALPSAKGSLAPAQDSRMDVLFFGDASGMVHCVEALTGAPAWNTGLGMEVVASPVVCDSVTQAAVTGYSDQVVVVATMDGKVYALDAAAGSQLWNYDTGSTDPIVSSPSAAADATHNWGMVWFQSTNGTVYCLHLGAPPGGGRLIWSHTTSGGTGSSPGVVLPYGMLPLGFDQSGEPVYPPACATGDPQDDGVVYIGTVGGGGSGGSIVALDAADGSVIWDYGTPVAIEASPAPTLGMMFISADQLYAFAPDTVAGIWLCAEDGPQIRLHIGPNPAGWQTSVAYGIPRECRVSLRVYDTQGRLVQCLYSGRRQPGTYKTVWDGQNAIGRPVAPGIYFVRLDAGDLHVSRKLVLVR